MPTPHRLTLANTTGTITIALIPPSHSLPCNQTSRWNIADVIRHDPQAHSVRLPRACPLVYGMSAHMKMVCAEKEIGLGARTPEWRRLESPTD